MPSHRLSIRITPELERRIRQRARVAGRRPSAVVREALVRQAKLGASCGVQVPTEQGLTNHSYRVLQLWRKPRCRAERHR